MRYIDGSLAMYVTTQAREGIETYNKTEVSGCNES